MTREETKVKTFDILHFVADNAGLSTLEAIEKAYNMGVSEQEPCEDAISRQAVIEITAETGALETQIRVKALPSVTPQPKTGHCKECKYFEYDSIAKVNGIPLIVAHEICKKWGDGCKTSEDGYCFLFEPQESEEV